MWRHLRQARATASIRLELHDQGECPSAASEKSLTNQLRLWAPSTAPALWKSFKLKSCIVIYQDDSGREHCMKIPCGRGASTSGWSGCAKNPSSISIVGWSDCYGIKTGPLATLTNPSTWSPFVDPTVLAVTEGHLLWCWCQMNSNDVMSYGTPCPRLHFTSKLSLMFGWFVPLSTRLEIQFAWRAAVAKHPWLPKESGIQELQKAKTQSYTRLVIHWSPCNTFLCEIVVLACSWVIHCSFRRVFHLPQKRGMRAAFACPTSPKQSSWMQLRRLCQSVDARLDGSEVHVKTPCYPVSTLPAWLSLHPVVRACSRMATL